MEWTGKHPKRLPVTQDELQRALQLLAPLTKGQSLRKSRYEELKEILGKVPREAELAQEWKTKLKAWGKKQDW